ncbi:MAG: phosphoglycerate kinase, partial [Gammaproteobacteria bacterium]|nr:phosphoglycerate kinase [Gammaproteobacteria bacterium]
MSFIKLTDLDLAGKRVLIRADLNVPVKDGKVTSDARITASMPTVEHCMKAGASVMVMSHRGRPEEGKVDEENSMQPIAETMSAKLGKDVKLVKGYLDNAPEVAAGDVVLLENVRFNAGEKKDNEDLAKKYASLCDVFVMDAFGTSHRAQASTHGVGKFAPTACAGLLLAGELDSLAKALAEPARPMVAIVGGSKVSTKLTVLEALSEKVDQLVVGGGIANTFLKAMGNNVGKSLCEDDLVDTAKALIGKMKARGASIPIATDVVCGKKFDENEPAVLKAAGDVEDDDMIFDIGPDSAKELAEIISKAGTIIWNGPVGVFEFDQFGEGTKAVSMAIANSPGFSLAGGGDTI